jgi:hypothetical protein
MPTAEDQLAQEWRAIILDKLKNLETGQASIQKDLSNLSNSYASLSEVHELRADVDKLKLYKAKVAGFIICANVVAIFIGWLIQSFIFAHH